MGHLKPLPRPAKTANVVDGPRLNDELNDAEELPWWLGGQLPGRQSELLSIVAMAVAVAVVFYCSP